MSQQGSQTAQKKEGANQFIFLYLSVLKGIYGVLNKIEKGIVVTKVTQTK